MGEKCVWIALVESASKRKFKCLALHTFFNTSIAVLMQRETAVAFHVLLSAVCLPTSTPFLCRTWPILKRAPWVHSLHTQRPGRSSAWLFGIPRLGVPPGRVVVTQFILGPQHQEPTKAVGSEMICQSNPDPFSPTMRTLLEQFGKKPKHDYTISNQF